MALEPTPDQTASAADLIARSASGDERVLVELGERYRRGMVTVAMNFVDSRAAEEVVEAALEEAPGELRAGVAPDDLEAWLHALARDRARDELRARLRQPPPEAWVPASAPVAVPLRTRLHDGVDRVRDLSRGPARIVACAAAVALVAAVAGGALPGGGGADRESGGGPALASADVTPPSRSLARSQPHARKAARLEKADRARPGHERAPRVRESTGSQPSDAPSAAPAAAPVAADTAPSSSSSSPPPAPSPSPTPAPAPSPSPSPTPSPPPPPPAPAPPPPAPACGSLSQAVPCVVDTVNDTLG